MDLSNLRPAAGSVHSDSFRRGRGHASGNGKTAGKGHKFLLVSWGAPRTGFEGAINVADLEKFENDTVVTVEKLLEAGVVKHARDGVKVLGNGELTKKLVVKVDAVSEGAKAKIEAAGGTCEVI